MRIDQVNRVNQAYNTKAINKTKPTAKSGSQDSLAISRIGRDMQVAKHAVENVNDVRMEQVNDVKVKLANNAYEKNMDQIVDVLASKFYK